MEFLGARIKLNPRPAQETEAGLEVAMLGHCTGRVRVDRLLALTDVVEEIRLLGLDSRIAELENGVDRDLYNLPLPFHSSAEFEDIFPDAFVEPAQYVSILAGAQTWLPLSVEDFFANGGEKLWVVRIPEKDGAEGFFPAFDTSLHDIRTLKGVAIVLLLNQVGLVTLPDLERIQIPARTPDIPRKRLINKAPQFLACGLVDDDGHRERRYPSELKKQVNPQPFISLLQKILSLLGKYRPDIQCLYSLPLDYSETLASPSVDESALADLEVARTQNGAHLLRQVQFLFPYLRSTRYQLHTATGVIAGMIAGSARTNGIWRSVAGLAMSTEGRPYPPASVSHTIALRESPGVGVISQRSRKLSLDDERLCVPALHRNDYVAGQYSESLNGLRSAEVVRFIGFLVRQLRRLGERLIFNISYNDPRPRLLLEKFFLDLYNGGALRGALPEDAFSIRQASSNEATIAFDIEIAPAFPVDKIVLTFINRDGEWLSEAQSG